jgi:uncharacterized membrane protein YjjB (DUF3815 family)
MTEIIQISTGFIGSLGFAILFNVRGRKLIFAALGGLFSWALFVLLGLAIESEPVRYFIVAASVSLYAEGMARILRTPTTTFIMTALIPLIPGGSLYYTMAYALESNLSRFMEKGIYTLELALALALGVIIAAAIIRTIFRLLPQKSDKA